MYDTLTASTTRDGLRIARVERPDLVILDASTRYAEVVAAASELRRDAETSGIPILVVLGNGRPRADDDLVKVSDDQVVKPLDRSEYVGKIRDLLSRRRRGGGRR